MPLFLTQFLGAFNDNLLKQSVILSILFYLANSADQHLYINLCALLFILPFFLFSAIGGLLGESCEKSNLIRKLKVFEIGTMLLAASGLWFSSLPLMMGSLFLTGFQSALFGPVKYSILPQHLKNEELVGGNAWVEMATFLAILLGTLCAGFLMGSPDYAKTVSIALLTVSALGYLASSFIPPAPSLAQTPQSLSGFNLFSETKNTLQVAFSQRLAVSRSLLGNSWFWFIGAVYLTQIPSLTKDVLHGDEGVVTLILTVFSVGIGLGSLLCERLSGGKVEIGLVPLGSIGLTLFSALLYWQLVHFPAIEAVTAQSLIEQPHGVGILFQIFALGLSGGLYIVPLYALLQSRSRAEERSRVIAGANILNAFFMVLASVYSIVMLTALKVSIPVLLLSLAVLNLLVNIYLFKIVPEFLMRFIVWIMTHTIYRVHHEGMHHIPDEGAAVLVCNHVSFMDALIISGSIRRPIRFVMYYKIFQWPVLSFVFRVAGAIPIAGKREDEDMYNQAFERVSKALQEGELVCIFPEGKLTSDGEIDEFKSGVRMILDRDPVPVIPMALRGLWHSFFSRSPKRGFLRRRWSKVGLRIGLPMSEHSLPVELQDEVSRLRGEAC
jgi:1-acyl-sn-glycerol-3-phosphate acyltransferase